MLNSVLTTTLLSAVVLTTVVGTEYYSGLPSVANKHFYEYGVQTADVINRHMDDHQITIHLTHPVLFFGVPYSSFVVSNSALFIYLSAHAHSGAGAGKHTNSYFETCLGEQL